MTTAPVSPTAIASPMVNDTSRNTELFGNVEINHFPSPLASSNFRKRDEHHQRDEERNDNENDDHVVISYLPESIRAVLMADGIQYSLEDHQDLCDQLPPRLDATSSSNNNSKLNVSKARLTWFAHLCFKGIGMFMGAYIIITTGQVKTIWQAQYPECWSPTLHQICPNKIDCCGLFPNTPINDTANGICIPQQPDLCNADDGTYPSSQLCSNDLLNSISYAEFAGIMIGMLTFGKIADLIGQVPAGILTSLLMIVGITVMSFYTNPNNVSTTFLVFSVMYGVFGWGVGGEYPLTAMSASSASSNQSIDSSTEDEEDDEEVNALVQQGGTDTGHCRHRRRMKQSALLEMAHTARRGETIAIGFAMQGIGAVFGSVYLLILLYMSGQYRSNCDDNDTGLNSSGSDPTALNGVWRMFYLQGGMFCVVIFLYRFLMEKESKDRQEMMWRKQQTQQQQQHDPSQQGGKSNNIRKRKTTWQVLQFYAPRLIGTGGAWFCLDVAFYGLKLYSGTILANMYPTGDLIVQNGFLLIYNLSGLVGYYVAASLLDRPSIGRKRFQIASFAFLTALYLLLGGILNQISPGVFLFLFCLSNFASNCGVNTTVYVIAAECYPVEVRGTCHGLSAFCGKLGAFVATVLFGTLSISSTFYVCGIVSAIGGLVTYIFGLELTHMSLAEHDAQFEFFVYDQTHHYQGKLNAPNHLSNWELWTGRHGSYDPLWATKLLNQNGKNQRPENGTFEDDEAGDSS